MSDIFDFGFTAVTEEELESVQSAVEEAGDVEQRLNKLYMLYNHC